jgi:hypothetical protein
MSPRRSSAVRSLLAGAALALAGIVIAASAASAQCGVYSLQGGFEPSWVRLSAHGDRMAFSRPAEAVDDGFGVVRLYQLGPQSVQLLATIPTPDTTKSIGFGDTIDLAATHVVIGAPSAGKAFVYGVDGALHDELEPSFPVADFGEAVATDGDVIVVGAPDNFSQTGPGTARIFRGLGAQWFEEAVLAAPSGADHIFGSSVDTTGAWVAVRGGSQVYLYKDLSGAGAWMLKDTLVSPAGLGVYQLSMDDGRLLVTAYEGVGATLGHVLLYEIDEAVADAHWELKADFPLPAPDKYFLSSSLAIHEDVAVTGVFHNTGSNPATNTGRVHAWRRQEGVWGYSGPIEPPVLSSNLAFGSDVALTEDYTVASGGVLPAGGSATWIFHNVTPPLPKPWTSLPEGAITGVYGKPQLSVLGPMCGGFDLTLKVIQLRENTLAFLVVGTSYLGMPFKGGVLITHPSLPVDPFFTGPDAGFSLTDDWPSGVAPGILIYVQVWALDAAAPQGVVATNGLTTLTP